MLEQERGEWVNSKVQCGDSFLSEKIKENYNKIRELVDGPIKLDKEITSNQSFASLKTEEINNYISRITNALED